VRLRSEGVNAQRHSRSFPSDQTCWDSRREASIASRTTWRVVDMRAQLILLAAWAVAVLAGVVAWVLNASTFDRWLEIHTGIADSTSPYYAFWSGFGSDIAEFGLVGAAVTAVYQLNRKFNCHQHGCWRIGTHPAVRPPVLSMSGRGRSLCCARPRSSDVTGALAPKWFVSRRQEAPKVGRSATSLSRVIAHRFLLTNSATSHPRQPNPTIPLRGECE